MAEVPHPRSFVAAQEHLLRELEDECAALQNAGTMDVDRLRRAVHAFAREVKEEGGSVERAIALMRACFKASGLDHMTAANRQGLTERTFAWTMEEYYGST